MKTLKRFVFILIFLLLAGCRLAEGVAIPPVTSPSLTNAPLPTVENTDIPLSTPAPTFTLTPTETSILTPTSIPTEFLACATLDKALEFGTFGNLDEWRSNLLMYLNKGGNPELLAVTQSESSPDAIFVAIEDVNKVPPSEIVVAATIRDRNVAEDEFLPVYEGALMIISCEDGEYTFPQQPFTFGEGMDYASFHQMILENVAGTEALEIIVTIGEGLFACTDDLFIYGIGSNEQWSPLYENQFPCYFDLSLENLDQDLEKEIIVNTSTSAGTMSEGLGREVQYTLDWSDNKLQLLKTDYPPSPYRIHVLEDAQKALYIQDYETALDLYIQAAEDPNLLNEPANVDYWNPEISWEDKDAIAYGYQTAFAYFRILTIQLLRENSDQANATLQKMQSNYLEGKAGYEFVLLAETYLNQINTGATPKQACLAVVLQTREENLPIGGHESHFGFWGDVNIRYEPDDMCPFR